MPRRPPIRVNKPRPVAALAPRRLGRAIGVGAAIVIAAVIAATLWLGGSQPRSSPRDRHLADAREALSTGHAAKAEKALILASKIDPADPEPWLLRLEMLRVEDRQVEAQAIGWEAYSAVRGRARRDILRAMTLALLADTPEDIARDTLARWSEADPDDLDAAIALSQRLAASVRGGDPDRAARVASLSRLVASHPDHVNAREALILALADSGEPDRGREVLDAWPEPSRDARYHRLKGRWALEYDRRYPEAVASFTLAQEALPHDWRTRARLARALKNAGRLDESRAMAESVERLREALDPVTLGPRLDGDLAALDDPKSRLDLASLCDRVGLKRLAEAWRKDAEAADSPGIDPLLTPSSPRG
jgi:thioredoxin-like negative regulator of GroEL